ncbi:TIGR01777 family oxidoreductase [Vitiosangium sp. GDMCC 1.1324]|uniref:TIGR01777 family oxidoreductase n=1 Tax=Vitiosangium sp. (strain GDMCC 1.1324) TaxID=2138576 RepID=UPI000D3BB930|nr:TIGR01777 family oxidoreductase [Vitiosangium sp. GDMCC 1.1324]PTL79374.1 TIGR01777 family protein [Vitiosangium sp. GDMCC 1.1324]
MGKSQVFEARSQMPVDAEEVFAWHAREGAFQRLTPPWEPVEVVEHHGDGIREGSRVVMRMRVGPVSLQWVARHTRYSPGSLFQDVQESGPFARWVHTHRMWDEPSGGSVLEDDVEYALPVGALGRVVGGGYARHRLERMFAYRHSVTREDLRRHAAFAGQRQLTVAVSGASGLVGSALVPFLTTGGHRVRRLVRGRPGAGDIAWAPGQGEMDVVALEGVDAVVHLAGAPIAEGRWTPERKALIRRSRVEGTRVLSESLARLARPPRVLVSASAMGFYGSRGDEVLTESSASGEGFLADVTREWEAATAPAEQAGIRVVHLRLGVVLSARGGALVKMLPAFEAGAGGRIGDGQQWMSWVSLEDVIGLVHFALFTEALRGPVNAVAPNPVRQEDFARTLGQVLSRPALVPLPAPAVRTLFGEMGEETLLLSSRIRPEVAERAGFSFLHPSLEQALRFTLGKTTEGPRFRHG